MKRIVAELTHLARKSPEISQRSGVSVRVSICNYENLLSNALKRAIRLGESHVAPRLSDLGAIVASTSGKIELETMGEASEDRVLANVAQRAAITVCNKSFWGTELGEGVAAFQGGRRIEVSDTMASSEYVRQLDEVRPLQTVVRRLGATDPPAMAAALE